MRTLLKPLSCLLLIYPLMSKAIIGGKIDETNGDGIIQLKLDDDSACTATKIGPHLLITAAHCFDENARILGFSNRKTNENLEFAPLSALKVESHPTYVALGNKNEYTEAIKVLDIALVKVQVTPDFEKIPSRELDFNEVKPGERLTFFGYGCEKSVNDLEGYIPKRKVAETSSLLPKCLSSDHGTLTSFYQKISQVIDRNNVVTSGKRWDPNAASICYGDSGGPLLKNGKVVGINSLYTFNDINEEGDSVSGISVLNLHNRLSVAKKWVQEATKELSLKH